MVTLAHFSLFVLSDTQGQQCQYFIFTLLYASIFVKSMYVYCYLIFSFCFLSIVFLLYKYIFNYLFSLFPSLFGSYNTNFS